MVEVALAVPFLILILLGVVDLGRLYYTYVAVANSAREAARYGAGQLGCAPGTKTMAQNKANTEATAAGITLVWDDLDGQIAWPEGCANGNPIQVITKSNFQLLTTIVFGGGTIPLQATTQFQVYYGSPP